MTETRPFISNILELDLASGFRIQGRSFGGESVTLFLKRYLYLLYRLIVSSFLASNYFFYGESLVEQFGVVINRGDFLPFLVRHHRFISFAMYIIGQFS